MEVHLGRVKLLNSVCVFLKHYGIEIQALGLSEILIVFNSSWQIRKHFLTKMKEVLTTGLRKYPRNSVSLGILLYTNGPLTRFCFSHAVVWGGGRLSGWRGHPGVRRRQPRVGGLRLGQLGRRLRLLALLHHALVLCRGRIIKSLNTTFWDFTPFAPCSPPFHLPPPI